MVVGKVYSQVRPQTPILWQDPNKTDELTCRLRTNKLLEYLANSSFALSARPPFTIPLDLHIDIPLYVMVKEFCPLESALEIRHAFQTFQDSNGKTSYGRRRHWNPPIIMFIRKGESEKTINNVQTRISDIFDQMLDDPDKYERWTMEYFEDKEEDFQTTILLLIGKYYNKGIKEHSIIKTSLKLLWFEYLLLNKFTIPSDGVGVLEAHLESQRPKGAHKDIQVIPDTINRFLKAIILPLAEKAAEQLTKNLHDMLFRMAVTQKLSKANTDIVLCMLFILMIFLGRTHNALLLLSRTPTEETGMAMSEQHVETKIRDMEEKLSDYFLEFHKCTLGRKSSRSTATYTEVNSACEIHANKFDLVGQLRRDIEEEYGKLDACSSNPRLWSDLGVESERPRSLKVGGFQVDTFRYMNVRRLCWKVVLNVEDFDC